MVKIPRSLLIRFANVSARLAERGLDQIHVLKKLAYIDPLTGVYNRNSLIPRLENEVSRAFRYNRPLSIALIDLDNFKEINDSLGHNAGDQALELLAQAMVKQVRAADVVVRYGGDEFLVVFPETLAIDARIPMERLRRLIERTTFEFDQQNYKFTLSIGITELPLNRRFKPEELIKLADSALYQAKADGRNQIVIKSSGQY